MNKMKAGKATGLDELFIEMIETLVAFDVEHFTMC